MVRLTIKGNNKPKMLDIKFIANNAELVQKAAREKGFTHVDVDRLLATYAELKAGRIKLEALRKESNANAAAVKKADAAERSEYVKAGAQLKEQVQQQIAAIADLEASFHALMLDIPNVIAEDTPQGEDDSANVPIKKYLEPTAFSFQPKDHLQLGKDLDLIDFDSGAKVAAANFYFLKNAAVLLEMALAQFAFSQAVARGYMPMRTPELARDEILLGAGYAPKGKESNTYRLEDRDLNLIATSEIAVGGYYYDEILTAEQLPLRVVAFSDCFRTEAGGGGRASKGLYRVHQFAKVELFAFTRPEQSEAMLEELLEIEESIYQQLQIPYQVVRICAGDLGAPAYKKYDIEAWMPGMGDGGAYGEVTSCSNCTDFQARRLKIRFKNPSSGKNEILHTLNGTAIAMSRSLIAILENYQQPDGSVLIPEVLQPYMGMNKIEARRD